jgi:hypothetical protein
MTVPSSAPSFSARTAGLLAAAFLLATALYAHPLLFPVLSQDDFQILDQSWTWQKTVEGLWLPNNEHAMPLGRLLTYIVAQLAGRPTALPFSCALTGVIGLLFGMVLAYLFVRRELGHPLYGLTAVVLFGVSSVYQQAVYWFAANFSVFALDVLLLALLSGQRYLQTGRLGWLLACVVGCGVAPCWFASGVLAGPLCCLYLLAGEKATKARSASWHFRWAPILGTVAFLAVSLPLTAPVIQHLEHYGDRTALASFQPLTGMVYTRRSVVDNLALGMVGITGVKMGTPVVPLILFVLFGLGAWWVRQSRRRRLGFLGLGLIFGSYLLIYSARATWDYDAAGMFTPSWGRYHLQPQLGLALVVCSGLPAWEGRWFRLDPTGRLTALQARALACLLGLFFLLQAPRGILCYYAANPRQAATLRLIERASAFCREHRIAADAARRELAVLHMPESTTVVNGWDFLRGSDDPRDWAPEEIREMLAAGS